MEPRNSCALADATISPKPISVSRQQDRNLLVCSLLNFMDSLLLVSVIRAFLSITCRNADLLSCEPCRVKAFVRTLNKRGLLPQVVSIYRFSHYSAIRL